MNPRSHRAPARQDLWNYHLHEAYMATHRTDQTFSWRRKQALGW